MTCDTRSNHYKHVQYYENKCTYYVNMHIVMDIQIYNTEHVTFFGDLLIIFNYINIIINPHVAHKYMSKLINSFRNNVLSY